MNEFCVIAFSNLATDGRVLRQIETLSELGKVTTIGFGSIPKNSVRHFSIPRNKSYLPLTFFGVIALLCRRFDRAFQYTPAVKWCVGLIDQINVDVFVLNDVQTIGLQDHIHKNCTVIIDMHEYAPEEMTDDWRFRLLLRRYYNHLCLRYLKRARLVVTVSDTIATKFEEQFGVETFVVRNVCAFQDLGVTKKQSSTVRLVHAGLASKGRRIEAMIDGISDLPGYELDLYLVPAPRQSRYFRRLLKKVEQMNNVHIRNPVSSGELVTVLNDYDIGLLVIHPSNFSLANCLPNKLFEFIQARLMIIAGPTPDIARIVRTYDLGLVLEGFSPDHIRYSLQQLTDDTINKFKENAQDVAHLITAELESESLKHLIRKVVNNGD